MILNNKKIIKNTIMLYIRLIIVMGVSLYTVRIVLEILGVKDFGIYNVIGSVVLMFGFLNSALTSSTQRFLIFQLGKNDMVELSKAFSISLIIHIGVAVLVFLFAETIGLWFIENKMNIPENRMAAAYWVFQFSVLTVMISFIQVPYNAMIIAYEKMSFYAYISIVEAILKLMVIYLLAMVSFDKLIGYAGFVFCVSVLILLFYYAYCKKHYTESSFLFVWDKKVFKAMLAFSGWSLLGSFAWVLMNQGINIMLNIFFGPIVNAARGISMQVNTAVGSLINSFRIAVNPQIIKMYSSDNVDEMKHLSLLSARYTFYLSLLIIVPLFLEIKTLLNIWLTEVPEWTVSMSKLILVLTLITNIDMSFGIVFQAIGKIKENQILSGITYMLVVPIAFFLTSAYNLDPTAVYYVQIVAATLSSFLFKVYLLNKLADISLNDYFYKFLFPIFKVVIFTLFFGYILEAFEQQLLINILVSCFIVISAVLFLDMDKKMRDKVLKTLVDRLITRRG